MQSRPQKAPLHLVVSCLLLIQVFLTGILFATASKDVKKLPVRYQQWFNRDAAYLITDEEKGAFLHLSTDEERDKFIDHFWEIRNPNPGSPTNTYRDEIYERIQYANQNFGHEGWRTDRGRIYILFGKPQQKALYVGQANVRPMEIWFYSSPHKALPPFFYIVFYQRDTGDEFRLYSPYMDGPDKLVTGTGAENDRLTALKVIDRSLGREVARTTLSLLPDEPVDLDAATSSLTSDVMLGTIRNLANNPFNKEMLDQHRRLLEAVSHRIVISGEFLEVLTAPLVDSHGDTNLHYVLRLKRPEDFTLQQAQDEQYYFSVEVVARVLAPDNKPIFEQERKVSQFLISQQVEQVKNKLFGYEGTLPLPPGKYTVEFVLSNELNKTAFREQREIVIPDPPAKGLQLTAVVPFAEAETGITSPTVRPFTAAGVKFTPSSGEGVALGQGRDLKFFYQIWAPPADPRSYGSAKLIAEYAVGRMGMHDTKTLQDELQRSEFDANGTLINGKKIPISDLKPGNYRMVVTVSDPATRERAFSSLNFRVVSSEPANRIWDVIDPSASDDARLGVGESQRALCYLSQGKDSEAIGWLTRSYRKDPSNEVVRSKLVELLFAKQQFQQIAVLYGNAGVTEHTDEQTILRIAESFHKLGQVGKSIQLLEGIVPGRQSGPLYLTLSSYYQQVGETQKAADTERKGKMIASLPPKS